VNESVGRGGPRSRWSRDHRGTGRKPRAGRHSGSRTPGSWSCKTSVPSCSGFAAVNGEDGAGAQSPATTAGASLEEDKPKRGAGLPVLSPVSVVTALVVESQSPESEGVSCGAGNRSTVRSTGRGQQAAERRCGSAERYKPLKGNPGRGSGMKQARKAGSGVNHRGRAKRRGWTVRSERGSSGR